MRTLLAVTAATLLLAAPAAAQSDAELYPQRAGEGTSLHYELDANRVPVAGRIPNEITTHLQAGYQFDRRAVATPCALDLAQVGSCPESSQIGDLSVEGSRLGPGVRLPLRLYLTEPQQPGDLAGVAAAAEPFVGDQQLPTLASLGRIFPGPDPSAFSISVAIPAELGTGAGTVTSSIVANLGRNRQVTVTKKKKVKVKVRRKGKLKTITRTKKVKRKVTRALIRNPAECPTGGWTVGVGLTFATGAPARYDIPVDCST